jgi:hypothetical protein
MKGSFKMMNTITLEQLYDTDEIGVRTYNVLRRGGFECLNELINKAVVDLIKIRNMSKNSMMQIAAIMKSRTLFICYVYVCDSPKSHENVFMCIILYSMILRMCRTSLQRYS